MDPHRCALLVAGATVTAPLTPASAAADAAANVRNLDPLYRRALTSATRSYRRLT